MRKLVVALALFVVALPAPQMAAADSPKLVVVLVVDQMRAEYVDQLKDRWTGGFRRLLDQGAWFKKAAYPYLNTVTCAGHSTVSTGTFPATHGMILNAWWDRDSSQVVSCTSDPKVTLVSYGAPSAGGDSAWRISAPTLTDELRLQKGDVPRMVTFSMKARAAIGLGGRSANMVTWFSDRDAWTTSTAYTSEPAPFLADFIKKNPVERDFDAVWTRMLPDKAYSGEDAVPFELAPKDWTTTFPHVLKGTSVQPDPGFYARWESSPFADDYLGKMAEAAVDALDLGRRDTVDYLGISFSTLDVVGHGFGPQSHEVQDVLYRLDKTLGELFDHLDQTVGKDEYTVALTADHGVTPIPESLALEGKDAGRINANDLVARVERVLTPVLGPGNHLASLAFTDLYFKPDVWEKLRGDRKTLDAVMRAIRGAPGIMAVFRGDELPNKRDSKNNVERAAALSYFPGRSGDLIIAPKPGWMYATAGTTHGTSNPDDQRVPIFFMGHGIEHGEYSDAITPADIAPTLAELIGIDMPKAEGHVLTRVLSGVPADVAK
jgi:predicted AlkP superfamily pyrophosphatase or phosphodiesterase